MATMLAKLPEKRATALATPYPSPFPHSPLIYRLKQFVLTVLVAVEDVEALTLRVHKDQEIPVIARFQLEARLLQRHGFAQIDFRGT